MNPETVQKFFVRTTRKVFTMVNLLAVVLIALSAYILYTAYDRTMITDSTKSIVNRLLWNANGECFFVKPSRFEEEKVYLVRVKDCNRQQ